ncbi:MAG: RecX family transcriptional regulator [Oscillospiraceae bacterium]|nr:RecX family transcriptional regulator [Oscillospiraceae bacterium]
MLEYRAHSRRELFDKLKRFARLDTVNEVLDMLEESGLIDDRAYAFQYAHDLMEMKLLGPQRLKMELSRKGIDDETAEEAILAAEEEIGSAEERLDRIIELRYKNLLTDEKNCKKIMNSLFRLGYGYDMIKGAIYKVKEDIADELYGNE